MSALYILVLVSLSVASFFLFAFVWSVRSDQFEDQEGSAMRMLHENDMPQSIKKNKDRVHE